MKTYRFNPASFTHPGSPGLPSGAIAWDEVEKIKASGSAACRRPARAPLLAQVPDRTGPSGAHSLGFALKMVRKNSLRTYVQAQSDE